MTWIEDLTDPVTGEARTLKLVTDNRPCFKSARFAAWAASRRHIARIRTRRRAPRTNGMTERFFETAKYEHLYRRDIGDGIEPADQARSWRTIYNQVRPHEASAITRPLDRCPQTPTSVGVGESLPTEHVGAAVRSVAGASEPVPSTMATNCACAGVTGTSTAAVNATTTSGAAHTGAAMARILSQARPCARAPSFKMSFQR